MPYVSRNDVDIYYESFGTGGPALVFLHPFSTNRYIWAFQVNAFAARHRCILIDHRGHGQSSKPKSGYAISEMAADVTAVLDNARVDRAILVGNSIGGMIAMQASLDAPHRVIGLVILSSGTNLGAEVPPEVGEAMREDWRAVFSQIMAAGVSPKSKAEKPEVVAFMEGCFRNDTNFTTEVFWGNASDPNGLFNWNISDCLREIQHPTLIIAGEEDGATTVAQNRFLAERIPNSNIKVYKDVGHFCQLEKPEVFNQELRNFIAQLT
jgi:3-oxoadipate enol-lactonase